MVRSCHLIFGVHNDHVAPPRTINEARKEARDEKSIKARGAREAKRMKIEADVQCIALKVKRLLLRGLLRLRLVVMKKCLEMQQETARV